MQSEPRVAFIIDALPALGGGEKVLFTALEAYPHADIFTLVYNQAAFVNTPLAAKKINTSYINSIPFVHKHHRMFLPLMPNAVERFDLRAYATIVSFSYAVAHGAKNHNGARHVSYTYTPMRYAWTDLNINGTHTRKSLILDARLPHMGSKSRCARPCVCRHLPGRFQADSGFVSTRCNRYLPAC
jgi:hypothetical protein